MFLLWVDCVIFLMFFNLFSVNLFIIAAATFLFRSLISFGSDVGVTMDLLCILLATSFHGGCFRCNSELA